MDVEDYLVSRSTVGGPGTVATVVASVLGAWLLFSPAEAATWAGIAGLLGYGLGQAAPLAALAYLGPRMREVMPQGHSLTEFVRHRFGRLTHGMTISFMLFYMFVFLVAELTAISLALQEVAQVPLLVTALIVAVATLAYTVVGGLRASVFTDGIQFVLIIPLLLVVLVVSLGQLGGLDAGLAMVHEQSPQLLSFSHRAGVAFGITLVIAILAANLFHQGFWQRVYACKDTKVLRRSYLVGALVAIPMVLLAGLFGLLAIGHGVPMERASVALFALAGEILPPWGLMVLLVLALALVMSSMDTLLNGIASAITVDLNRLRGSTGAGLLRSSRMLTVLITIPAIAVAARGESVLYLFLIADLVCSAAVFPVFFGLFARNLTDRGACLSALSGLAVGLLFFPKPDFSPWFNPSWLHLHHDFQFLASFGSALLVSTTVAVIANALAKEKNFDFTILAKRVTLLEK
jgi:Na+/proline symporter